MGEQMMTETETWICPDSGRHAHLIPVPMTADIRKRLVNVRHKRTRCTFHESTAPSW